MPHVKRGVWGLWGLNIQAEIVSVDHPHTVSLSPQNPKPQTEAGGKKTELLVSQRLSGHISPQKLEPEHEGVKDWGMWA